MPGPGPSALVDGRIVARAPTSPEPGRIEGCVFRLLDAFVRPRELGTVVAGGLLMRRRRRNGSRSAAHG